MTETGEFARGARSVLPAIVVALAVTVALVVPQVLSLTVAATDRPVFPSTVASYSWWTTSLAPGDLDRATVVYQNGVGVEFLDAPQAVVIGDDGSTYRRLGVAEARSTPADQGDPVRSVLAPDGSFAVVASGTEAGAVTVVDLSDGVAVDFPIGEGLTAVPQSITADGRTVLLLVGEDDLSRYSDLSFRLRAALMTLDLSTGAVRELSSVADVNVAALSPDGRVALVDAADGFWLVDTSTGVRRPLDGLEADAAIGGAAFSPSAARIASTRTQALQIDELSDGSTTSWELSDFEYAGVVGWRDEDTVLVQGVTDIDANTSALAWVDVATGKVEVLSTYAPDVTGAAMWISSVAAALVPQWSVADTHSDRGLLPIGLSFVAAIASGLLTWLLTPRRRALSRLGG